MSAIADVAHEGESDITDDLRIVGDRESKSESERRGHVLSITINDDGYIK